METPESYPLASQVEIAEPSEWGLYPSLLPNGTTVMVAHNAYGEHFLLTDNYFEEIDQTVSKKISALLVKKVKENPMRQIVAVDLGGGSFSSAALGLAGQRHPFLAGRIYAANIDPFANEIPREQLMAWGINPNNFKTLRKDFLRIEGCENAADIVVSYQVLPYMKLGRLIGAIDKVAAILAPGGEAYLEEGGRLVQGAANWKLVPRQGTVLWQHPAFNRLQAIADSRGVVIAATHCETPIDGTSPIIMPDSRGGMIYVGKLHPDRSADAQPRPDDFQLAYPQISGVLFKG